MSSNFNPLSLLASPITGAFQLAGAKDQADAAKQAAQLQATAAQNALDWTKQQKAAQLAAYAPYSAVGQQAVAQLPGAVRPMPAGGPPPAYSGPPPLAYMGQGGQSGPATYQPPSNAPLSQIGAPQQAIPPTAAAPVAPGTPAGGAMVTLQAPDGTTKQVPQSQAQFYISRGAKQV